MNSKQQWAGQVNPDGSLTIPPELAAKFGLKPGARVVYEESPNEFHVLRPASHLAKIYVEPTDLCNLECRTCARNVWEEPMGMMSQATGDLSSVPDQACLNSRKATSASSAVP